MTIAELIELLKEQDQAALVVLSHDGNRYSLADGSFAPGLWSPSDNSEFYYLEGEDDAPPDDAVPAVAIFPV